MNHRPPAGFERRTEIEVRRSRFLALLARADEEEGARTVVAGERRRYPDARHHCSAFIVNVPGAQPIERSSDDGEPAGTAGIPMLDVLRASGLQNAVVVVTRYFGGVKLGTGGLVRAYSDAVTDVLDDVTRVIPVERHVFSLELGHADAGRVQAELVARGVELVDIAYGAGVVVQLTHEDPTALAGLVAAATRGDGELRFQSTTVVEVPFIR